MDGSVRRIIGARRETENSPYPLYVFMFPGLRLGLAGR